jgi:hypothetical protein
VPLLGQIPIDLRLREGGDSGSRSCWPTPTARSGRHVAERLPGRPVNFRRPIWTVVGDRLQAR